MALTAQPSNESEGAQGPASGDQQGGQPDQAVALPVKQSTGQPEATVTNQQAHTAQPDPYDLRDLIAQEEMADWGFGMLIAAVATFIVTSIGTLLIWRQVRLTREAVEDTGKATKAMERQNELTAIAQRPWIKLDARVTKIEVRELGFDISVAVDAKNIGKSVAMNTSLWALLVQGEDRLGEAVQRARKKLADDKGGTAQIVPGEAVTHWSKGGYTNEHAIRFVVKGRARFPLMIFAAAKYYIPGDPEPHVTERAFSIVQGKHEDPFDMVGIDLPVPMRLKIEDLIILPAGRTRAT